jgi:hypothetical protein
LWLVVRIESDGHVGTGEEVKNMRRRIQSGVSLARDPDGSAATARSATPRASFSCRTWLRSSLG